MQIVSEKKKIILLMLFFVYILVVLNLTIFRFGFQYDDRQLNLMLFTKLISIYRNAGVSEFLRLFLGNIGWFFPFGFLLPVIMKKKSFFAVIVFGFIFSIIIETIQFFTRKGVAELDDVILNTLGVVIGYLSYKIVYRIKVYWESISMQKNSPR
ncbi:MAG: VanZ family protein [Oscillospiraceae bacterium]|nr:VanZ family protein [Oscillospiraceae bacterium]